GSLRRLPVEVAVQDGVLVAPVVEVLDDLSSGRDASVLLACAKGIVNHGPAPLRLVLRADERPALARFDVLEPDDPPDVAVELDVHPILELVRVDGLGHAARKAS